jgi:hypothetical protein
MVALVDELSTCSLAASECLTRVYQVAQAAAVAKLESDDGLLQHQELAARIINDVNLLVQRVAVIQGFAYENFLQYVDNGATPVLGDDGGRRRTSSIRSASASTEQGLIRQHAASRRSPRRAQAHCPAAGPSPARRAARARGVRGEPPRDLRGDPLSPAREVRRLG